MTQPNSHTIRQTFTLRAYGRTELALLYNPHMTGAAAWRKLRQWIAIFPGLPERLAALGYNGRQRSFTPTEVAGIVESLGEP